MDEDEKRALEARIAALEAAVQVVNGTVRLLREWCHPEGTRRDRRAGIPGLAQTALGTWRAVAPMPTSRYFLAAATGLDGKVYAIGGT